MTRICKSCNFAKTNFYQGHSSCVECVKSRQQKWYQNNKSRNYTNARKSKLSDSVRAHNYDAKYRSKPNNKERQRLHNANRRARERNAQGEFTAKDICELMEKQNGCCNHCGHNIRHKYHIDHIVPLVNGVAISQRICSCFAQHATHAKAAGHLRCQLLLAPFAPAPVADRPLPPRTRVAAQSFAANEALHGGKDAW